MKFACSMLAASDFRVASVVLGFSESVALTASAAESVDCCRLERAVFTAVMSTAPNMQRISKGARRANMSATAPSTS